MTKKNLPNIPIYIGDWERDCNVLSLESEAAWMRIVFKLWTKGKQNAIKMTTKALQNLWRCSPEKMREILDELIYNEIAEIKESQGFVSFTCRRFVKENKLSETRRKARNGQQTDDKPTTKEEQKHNKTITKRAQNTDIEIDNDNEIVNYLNIASGKNFKPNTPSTVSLINARLKEYTPQDLKDVIDLKCAEWRGTKMAKYLRPATLFNATKFESYIQDVNDIKNGNIKNNGSTKQQRLDAWERALNDSTHGTISINN